MPAASKSLRTSTELLLLAPLKPGLVALAEPTTYATRLEKFFEVLFALRKRSVELEGSGFVGPLERLRTLHFVRFAIIDKGTRLLLAVTFDKPWEPYIRSIVDDAGPILDVICSHCIDFEKSSSKDGYPAFARWVRKFQIEANFFHAGFPEQTVDDVHYLKKLQSQVEQQPKKTSAQLTLAAKVPGELDPGTVTDETWATFERVLIALYRLRTRFPKNSKDKGSDYSDQAIFDRAAHLILTGFGSRGLAAALQQRVADKKPRVRPDIEEAYNGIEAWLGTLMAEGTAAEKRVSDPPPRLEGPFDKRVQGIVHPGYPPLSHGCLVLLSFSPGCIPELLQHLADHTTCGTHVRDEGVKLNVGFTRAGLSKLGVDDGTLDKLPVEFRQGMEARAGLLGDVGTNHPEKWQRPKCDGGLQAVDGEPVPDEVDLNTVDAVVILQVASRNVPDDHRFVAGHPLREAIGLLRQSHATILHVQPLRRSSTRFEGEGQDAKVLDHFGYVEGISQPTVGTPAKLGGYDANIALGELLIGHTDDHDDAKDFAGDARLQWLLFEGSYMVIRKLAQDRKAFVEYVQKSVRDTGLGAGVIEGKLMGREPHGLPTTTSAVSDRAGNPYPNAFDYRTGQPDDGDGCPRQAHIRLSNPRLPVTASIHGNPKRTPKIARRGFSYGPSPENHSEDERGLLFMACNAKIAEQYEVIQRWLNGANSTGMHSSHKDPITAPHEKGRGTRFTFTHAGQAYTLAPAADPLVTLRWGMYVFVPSMKCLHMLPTFSRDALQSISNSMPQGLSKATRGGNGVLDPDAQRRLTRGEELLKELEALDRDDPRAAKSEWKKLLEDSSRRTDAFAVWTAIRERGGVLRTAYGVLVGSHAPALEVLGDEARFSVREYWLRMHDSSMMMYLGMDQAPVRQAVCPMHAGTGLRSDQPYVAAIGTRDVQYAWVEPANRYIHDISRVSAFLVAFNAVQRQLNYVRSRAVENKQPRAMVDLVVLADEAISQVSQVYFGLPDGKCMEMGGQPTSEDDTRAYCPGDFTVASQYIFRPNPDTWTEKLAKQRGAAVQSAATDYVANHAHKHPFVGELKQKLASFGLQGADLEAEVVRSLVGAVDGFVAANWGSFISTIKQWIDRDELARIQPKLRQLARLCPPGGKGLELLPEAWSRTEAEAITKAFDLNAPPDESDRSDENLKVIARWYLGRLGNAIADGSELALGVIDTLKVFPVPPWLHRTAMSATKLGGVDIAEGDKIAVHLGSSALDQPGPDMLFGGKCRYDVSPQQAAPLHACPGRELALGVLMGMLTAVLQEHDLRRDEGTLMLSFRAT